MMVDSIYVDSNAFVLPVVGEDSMRAKGATSLLRMIYRWKEMRGVRFGRYLGRSVVGG